MIHEPTRTQLIAWAAEIVQGDPSLVHDLTLVAVAAASSAHCNDNDCAACVTLRRGLYSLLALLPDQAETLAALERETGR